MFTGSRKHAAIQPTRFFIDCLLPQRAVKK